MALATGGFLGCLRCHCRRFNGTCAAILDCTDAVVAEKVGIMENCSTYICKRGCMQEKPQRGSMYVGGCIWTSQKLSHRRWMLVKTAVHKSLASTRSQFHIRTHLSDPRSTRFRESGPKRGRASKPDYTVPSHLPPPPDTPPTCYFLSFFSITVPAPIIISDLFSF